MSGSADGRRRRQSPAFRLALWLVPPLLDWYLRFVDFTSRKTVYGEEYDTFKTRGETCMYVSFHQGLLYFIQHFRDRGTVVMASRSRDGDLIAAILKRFGWRAVRGSSSRGGKEALAEMVPVFRDETVCGGLVCDAPRGPYGDPKIGIVLLARDSGRPMTPSAYWTTRLLLGRNWDRTIIPLPFSHIHFAFDEPIPVPPDASREECERLRRRMGDRVLQLTFRMQEAAGAPRQDFRPAEVTAAAEVHV